METGIRELEDNLSRYLRRMEAGERIIVTAHGRVVAEIVPPVVNRPGQTSKFDRMITSGIITPPVENGEPLENCLKINLPTGTAATLINQDRDEA